jgi:ribonuclease HI
MVVVFSDGAAQNNGKANAVGGIGVWFGDGDPRNISKGYVNGAACKVTNQTMELLAAVSALQACATSSARGDVVLFTDSMYAIQCATKWYIGWKRNGWKTATGKPVLNQALIEALVTWIDKTGARLEHVRSHRTEPAKNTMAHAVWYGNRMADALAVQGASSASRSSPQRGSARPAPPRQNNKVQQQKITQWFFSPS